MLDRKGFTLIELLAVIVILAIILAVTIPTVLSALANARQDTFNAAANTVADWFEKQYASSLIGSADATYTGFCTGTTCEIAAGKVLTPAVAIAAGINGTDFDFTASTGTRVTINPATARACVRVVKSSGGKFANVTSPSCSVACATCP